MTIDPDTRKNQDPRIPGQVYCRQHRHVITCIWLVLLLGPTLRDLGSLNGRHLLQPTLGGLRLLDSAKVIGGEAGDAHVVVAFQDELDVADFEGRRRTQLGEAAGLSNYVVDEIVSHLKDEL